MTSARIVPNEGEGSSCTFPEICMVGVLGRGQMIFIWRIGGQLKKWGVELPVPPANRALGL